MAASKPSRGRRVAVALAVALLAVPLLLATSLVRAKLTLRRYDRFAATHQIGRPMQQLLADPFLDEVQLLILDGEHLLRAPGHGSSLADLRERIELKRSGTLQMMWVYLYPFGRVILEVDFTEMRITQARQWSLD